MSDVNLAIQGASALKCPHCLEFFHGQFRPIYLGSDEEGEWGTASQLCPACKMLIVAFCRGNLKGQTWVPLFFVNWVRPRAVNRRQLPPEVPATYADDYREACLVLADSPKASAALGRRCLQGMLRSELEARPGSLASEIDQVLSSGKLPPSLADSIDAVRNVGNFAAHPQKSTASGELLPVEEGEAEWTLDVLEALMEFLFVQPAQLAAKRGALNEKLAAAGKPPMKQRGQ